MEVNDYLASRGLIPLSEAEYSRILGANLSPAQLAAYQRLFDNFNRCGDEPSTRAFYTFEYGVRMSDGIPLYQLWERCFGLSFIRAILPHLVLFCEGARQVLDAGCGNALQLGYLALRYPGTDFVGIDRIPEAIALSEERFRHLVRQYGLRNVTFFCKDCYELPHVFMNYFDAVIMVNVLDDERKPLSAFSEAEFNTRKKMEAIRKLLKSNGRVWLSLTPTPAYTDEFEGKLLGDIRATGFKTDQPLFIPYEMQGKQHQHMALSLTLD